MGQVTRESNEPDSEHDSLTLALSARAQLVAQPTHAAAVSHASYRECSALRRLLASNPNFNLHRRHPTPSQTTHCEHGSCPRSPRLCWRGLGGIDQDPPLPPTRPAVQKRLQPPRSLQRASAALSCDDRLASPTGEVSTSRLPTHRLRPLVWPRPDIGVAVHREEGKWTWMGS